MTEILTKFGGHAFYQVLALPAKPGRINRYAAKHKLKSALEKSHRIILALKNKKEMEKGA